MPALAMLQCTSEQEMKVRFWAIREDGPLG